MMNKNLLAVAVAALSLVASSAYALDTNPNQPVLSSATTGSDLSLTIWDITTNTSYVQILETAGSNSSKSITESSFLANNSFATETLNSTAFEKFVNSTSAGDQIVYEVQAAANTSASANFGFLTTISTQADNATSAEANNAAVLASLANYDSGISNVGTSAAAVDGYLSQVKSGIGQTATSGNDAYAANGATYNASVEGFHPGVSPTDLTGVAVGQAANFFFATANGAGPTDKTLGAWDLSINGTTGTLSYNAAPVVSAVPVPAAVWMMLSGLLGVLSVSRRKTSV